MIACNTLGSQHRLPGDHDSALLPGFFSFVLTAASHHPNTEVSLCLPTSASRMWSMVSLSHSPSQPQEVRLLAGTSSLFPRTQGGSRNASHPRLPSLPTPYLNMA